MLKMTEKKYTYRFKFSKTKDMIYISHLDLIRLFGRAIRRAGLPIALTEGFNPHPKFKLKRALKLGLVSLDEEAEMVLNEQIQAQEIFEKISKELPPGIKIEGVIS